MKKIVLFAALTAASLSISACGKKADEAAPDAMGASSAAADAMGDASADAMGGASAAASEDAMGASTPAKM